MAYFYSKSLQLGQSHFDVLSPADGFIVVIRHRTQLEGSSERVREYEDYDRLDTGFAVA
jgi:hypothetical protein